MLIIDRFEGDFAVCTDENRVALNINITDIPPKAMVGDSLVFENGIYQIDKNATQNRKNRISKLMNDLFD